MPPYHLPLFSKHSWNYVNGQEDFIIKEVAQKKLTHYLSITYNNPLISTLSYQLKGRNKGNFFRGVSTCEMSIYRLPHPMSLQNGSYRCFLYSSCDTCNRLTSARFQFISFGICNQPICRFALTQIRIDIQNSLLLVVIHFQYQ